MPARRLGAHPGHVKAVSNSAVCISSGACYLKHESIERMKELVGFCLLSFQEVWRKVKVRRVIS